jgi:methylmalonyl-CoA mutase, N-terminal domain
MFDKDELDKIKKQRAAWESGELQQALKRFGVTKSPNAFYTPLDIKDHDFLRDVNFPGKYPYTAGRYASQVPGSEPVRGGGHVASGGGLIRAGRYSGYGTAEDSRDYYKYMISRGQFSGPNLAFDLPTQCGLDPDDPLAKGEVGKVGVAITTLQDMEILYEAFVGEHDLDKIHSAYTINPLAPVILAMYIALGEKRGIPSNKLRCTPQNDILKEAVARGTQIFPLKHSMRLTRDCIVYGAKNMPFLRPISITGYHFREAGATREQTLAWTLSDAISYVQLGLDAGLDVDAFIQLLSFLNFSGSLEMFKEVALRRAGRRMWAKITRERFKAKDQRSWIMREAGGNLSGSYSVTTERPLNNLTRSVIGGVAAALSGEIPTCWPPYDESLGLGHSIEALQLTEDAARIIQYESHLADVLDPLAGSYYVEALTDQIEKDGWEIINKIDSMGGMVAAIESGYIDRELAQSAYQYEKEVESGERVIVGVNRFTSEDEVDVRTTRAVPDPYDADKRAQAEEHQIAKVKAIKKKRDNKAVTAALKHLKEAAGDESANLIPVLVEAVKTYASIGEIYRSLRDVFGTYKQPEL